MKNRRKSLGAIPVAIVATLAVTLTPTAASAAPVEDRIPICQTGATYGYMEMFNNFSSGSSIAATYRSGAPCTASYHYLAKFKYIVEGEIHYYVAPWAPNAGDTHISILSPTWNLLASCHGYRADHSQPWNFYYMAADGFPTGGGGSQDCDDAGNW